MLINTHFVTCLERLCEKWQVGNQKIKELINLLWTFTSSNNLDLWDKRIRGFLPHENWEVEFGYGFLYKDKLETLTDVLIEVIEIGGGNLYGGFRSEFTMRPTIKVASLLEANNIELPDLEPFKKSKVTEFHGWGNPVGRDFFSVE